MEAADSLFTQALAELLAAAPPLCTSISEITGPTDRHYLTACLEMIERSQNALRHRCTELEDENRRLHREAADAVIRAQIAERRLAREIAELRAAMKEAA